MREHGSLKLGGGIYERTWVSQAGWGGYTRDHGFLKLGGRIYERTWGKGAMEVAIGICIWGGGYRKRQSSSLILVGPEHV